ncbi:MAG TPA: hypothetical protein VMM78_02390 [Thermomicrobiales bacterium]|nr:hypothetical protein [Thermomicrobiales bacterium]
MLAAGALLEVAGTRAPLLGMTVLFFAVATALALDQPWPPPPQEPPEGATRAVER